MTTSTLQIHLPVIITTQATGSHPEITRLLAAAVVNRRFRKTLLDDPAQALSAGYQGEKFILTDLERDLLLSIRANSLSELAGQLISALEIGQQMQYPQTNIQRTFNTL